MCHSVENLIADWCIVAQSDDSSFGNPDFICDSIAILAPSTLGQWSPAVFDEFLFATAIDDFRNGLFYAIVYIHSQMIITP